MKFIKYVFLSTFLTCICCVGLMEIAHACVTHNDSNKTCGGLRPPACSGSFCKGGIAYECRSGCYCTGGMSTATSQNIANMCANHQDPGLTNVGIYLCPDTHPHSNSGAGSVNDCYQLCNEYGYNVRYAYYQSGCGAGKYLQAAHENCEDCPAGKYCKEETAIISSCTSDQGITGLCTGNEYSTSGAQVCSTCNGEGRAVKKNNVGTLNIGCDVCDYGTYANDGHTACEICEEGYACTNGIKTQCTGNQYSGAGASQCTECTGNGKAVVKNGTLNVGCDVCPPGKYANADHTQCIDCPPGHACSNGVDNDLCPPGTCAAYQGSGGVFHCVNSRGAECKTCSEINSSKPYSVSTRTQCVECDGASDYYENGECQSCPNVPYNASLYSPVRIDGQSGTAMCGIKLTAGNCDISSENDVSVKWHIVNNVWKLMDEISVKADMRHYVKDPSPTSPDGSDADWCGTCPNGKFNIYTNRTGESACVACPVGYCTSNNSCLQCKAGYYCPGTDDHANSCGRIVGDYGIEKLSFICKKGSFSAPGQVSCTKCASGYTTYSDGTSYNPDDDSLDTICQKIKIKLKFGDTPIWFPDMNRDIFKNVKMNASVLPPQ